MATEREKATKVGRVACLGVFIGFLIFLTAFASPFWIITSDGENLGLWNCPHTAYGNGTCVGLKDHPDKLMTMGMCSMAGGCILTVTIFFGDVWLRNKFLTIGLLSGASAGLWAVSIFLVEFYVSRFNGEFPDRKITGGWSFKTGAFGAMVAMVCAVALMYAEWKLRCLRAEALEVSEERSPVEEGRRVQIVQHARSCPHREGGGNLLHHEGEFVAQLGYRNMVGPHADFIQDVSMETETVRTV